MDDVWGNAWSTPSSSDSSEVKNPITTSLKLNAFERDADDDTVDLGATSWNAGTSGVGWGGAQSNLWQAKAPTLDAWGSEVAHRESDGGDEGPEAPEDEDTEDGKDPGIAPRTILPTPPQSPLPLPSPPPAPSPVADETPPSTPAPVPGSPDPFGSFESAADDESQHTFSLTTKSPEFPPETADEPWGGAWGRAQDSDIDEQNNQTAKDEWALAQEAKRRQERKVPPQLLASLIDQWEDYAKDIASAIKSDDSGSQSWRKGLDNVEGLTDLVDSLVPAASFPPPIQLPKSAAFRALRESLRLTRSFSLTQSSPMAHLYASKGSTDWERSVKSQKTAANDEWGWDLKHEPEEKLELTDSAKERKVGGLLSFWNKKASPNTAPVSDSAVNIPKSPTLAVKPMSPTTSARPSVDISPNTSSSAAVSPTLVSTPSVPATATADSGSADITSAQPSVVSRFFNRFSRKPSASPTPSENDNRSSLALSSDDIAALSDMVPSRNSSLLHGGHDSAGSLEAMLSSPPLGARSSPSKLPPPLAPPPAASRTGGPSSAKSNSSDSSFDMKMADAQLLDIIENLGMPSSGPGYAPVSFDLIDTPEEPRPPSKPRSQAFPSPPQVSSSPPLRQQTPPKRSSWLMTPNPTLPSPLPPPLPPPLAAQKSEARLSGFLNSTTPPPQSPLRHSFGAQRYDNPLPPTPQQEVDDFSEFFSASKQSPFRILAPPPSSANLGLFPTPARQTLPAASTGTAISADDLGDFGDFISPSARAPSPKVSQRPAHAANHKPTQELVEKAASMAGSWPAAPPALPQPLAPPPGQERVTASSRQRDLLGDDSPLKPSPASGVSASPALSPPLFPASRPASTSFPGLAPSPPPALTPRSATSSPLTTAPTGPPAKSGLSAQDLSFFEGL